MSRYVFYTHGLFGSPFVRGRRRHTLLGHGHGPKSASNSARPARYGATFAITNNSAWGGAVTRDQGVGASQLLCLGNPRDDAFNEIVADNVFEKIGIDSEKPIVLWLPTYRISTGGSQAGWQDGENLAQGNVIFQGIIESAARLGVQLVVKAHPLDENRFQDFGVRVVTSEHLTQIGLSFYQFLSLTDAVISDYSSVWVDYLASAGSVALYCPDEKEFGDRRGLNEPYLFDLASDFMLASTFEVNDFFNSISSGRQWRPRELSVLRQSLGFAGNYSRSERIVDCVMDRQPRS